MTKTVEPSASEAAFTCPHCGAYTSQTWYALHATMREGDSRTPNFPDSTFVEDIKKADMTQEMKESLYEFIENTQSGLVFIDSVKGGKYHYLDVSNLNISRCYVCRKFAVWVFKSLAFPPTRTGPTPNEDLPADTLRDYEEASAILSLSPRGAAALLRLAIQKLCGHLGEKGKNIDDDIAALVRNGLSPMIQKALDSVRVTGNEAVHPGTLDLRDEPETAHRLFKLVNVIAEQMISNPKHVEEAYGKLPEVKRKAIETRDKPT